MYVCTYVCREEKQALQHAERGREGHAWHGRNVERGNEKENQTHLNELTNNSSPHGYRVPPNDYDRPLSSVPSLLKLKAAVTRAQSVSGMQHQVEWEEKKGERIYTHSVIQSYKNL